MSDTGSNSGLSVAVSIIESSGATTVLQLSEIFLWGVDLAASVRRRLGRTNTLYPQLRPRATSGSIGVKGETNHRKAPVPQTWAGLQANLTITGVTNAAGDFSVIFPVKIVGLKLNRVKGNDDVWNVDGNFEIVGAPTWGAGYGSLLDPTAPSKANEEQWKGTGKVYDPQGLQSFFKRTIDFWGTLANTDAAEETLIVSTISSSTPFTTPHNAKLRRRTFDRDALDGGTITELWGLTDTAEDWINANTNRFVDSNGISDSETVAAFGVPGNPNNTDLKTRGIRHKELNDSKIGQVKEVGRRDTLDDSEIPGEHFDADPNDFGETAVLNRVTTSDTPPSVPSAPVGQHIRTVSVPINRANGSYTGHWRHSFFYGPTTTKQLIEQEGKIDRDVSSISGTDVQTLTGTSSTPEADPATRISGMVIIRRISYKVQNTPEKWKHVYIFGWLTAEQAIEHRTTAGGSNISPAVSTVYSAKIDVATTTAGTTQADLAVTLDTAARNVRHYKGVAVRKINTTIYEAKTEYRNEHLKIVFSGSRSYERRSPVDATGAYVKVMQPRETAPDAGQWWMTLGGYNITVVEQDITIWRDVNSISNIDSLLYRSNEGTTNNGSLFNRAAGTIKFIGATVVANWGLEGTSRAMTVQLRFTYRNIGWWEANTPRIGYRDVYDVDLSAVESGGAVAATAFSASWVTDFRPSTDMSAMDDA